MTYIAVGLQVIDFLLVYPTFKGKKFFPNQVVIVIETIITIIVLLGCLYSKISGNLKIMNPLLVLLTIRLCLGFLNNPSEEASPNYQMRRAIKNSSQIAVILLNINLMIKTLKASKWNGLVLVFILVFIMSSIVLGNANY